MHRTDNDVASGRERPETWDARALLREAIPLTALLVAALPSVVSGTPESGGWGLDPGFPVVAGFTIGVGIAVIARRRWPLPAFVAMAVLTVLSILTDAAALVVTVGIAVNAYAMATATPRRRAVIATCTVAAALGIVNIITVGQLTDPSVYVLPLVTFAAAAVGDSTRSRRELLSAALDRAERAEQTREAEAARRVAEERLRIARDLHDGVGHRMTVISLHAGAAAASLEDNPDEARRSLHTIGSSARSVLTEIQQLLNLLRTDRIRPEGEPVVGLTRLDELIADLRGAGMTVVLIRTGDTAQIDPVADAVAFRVIQEALVNATRHGSGSVAHVAIEHRERLLTVRIANDRVPGRAWTAGNGLRGMRERVEAAGGTLAAGPTGVRRFEVNAALPTNGTTR